LCQTIVDSSYCLDVMRHTSIESQLSETPFVWRNTSVTLTRDITILVRGVNQFLIQCLLCDFVVPVLADNPLAYCPALISLYLEVKETSGETRQCL